MKMKQAFRAASAGMTAFLLLLSGAAFAQPITKEQKEEVLERMSTIITTNAFVPGKDFSQWPQYLEKNRKAIDEATDAEEFAMRLRGSLESFGISHIVLIPPKAAQQRRDRKIVGIGVSLRPEPEGLRVWNVFPKAPAGEAGIEIGDLIMEVDGKKAESINPIAGDENTQVVLKVQKHDGKVRDYTITRRAFSTVRPETLTWADKDTAVLKVWSFDMGHYNSANVEKLMDEAHKAKNLIVDLRSNGGGAVLFMNHLLNLLLPEGSVVGSFIDRGTVRRYTERVKDADPNNLLAVAEWNPGKMRSGSAKSFKGKIAVLIDGGSGSASEITAAALKEVLNAPVIGTKSAGAVLASMMAPLPHGFMLQFPVTDYVTLKGVRLEGNGVLPDLEVPPMNRVNEADVAVEKAIAILNGADIKSLKARKDGE